MVPVAIDGCARASLVFDLAAIETTMRRVADAARATGVRALFAAKSFPHPAVRALAAELLDGFDVASPAEAREAGATRARIVSIADPSGAALAHAPTTARVICACETVDQVRAAPAHAEIAVRMSASITGRDPAIGAVLDGNGHRRSRFGVATSDEVAALARAAAGRPVGIHVHHGPVVATSGERFAATARAALGLAHAADVAPAFLDLGGAWHGVADLAGALADVRAALPRELELVIEPGRLYSEGAGFACGIVQAARTVDRRELRVIDLSRICHLRWCAVDLVARAPHPGTGRDVLFVGPTCFEDDAIGQWTIDPATLGTRAVFRGVTGYALGWNTGFGGVPPADVIVG